MALDPLNLTDFEIAKNMIQRLVSEKGYSYEDAEAIVNRELRSTVLAATRSNDRADYAKPMNAEVDKTAQEKAREQARNENANSTVRVATDTLSQARAPRSINDVPSHFPSLMGFYSRTEPNLEKAERLANIEMGKRMAAKAYAEEYANIQNQKAAQKAESQDSFMTTTPIGRAISSFAAPNPTHSWLLPKAKPNEDPNHDAKLEARQRALSQVSAVGPVVYGSPFQEQTPEQYASDLLRNRIMRDTLVGMGEQKSVLGRMRMPDPVMPLQRSLSDPAPSPAPEDAVPGWGRKVEGPSASTYEFGAPDPATPPTAASPLTDRVHPKDLAQGIYAPTYVPIGGASSLPMFARKNEGAVAVPPVQNRTIDSDLIRSASDRIAPYSMQFNNADLMKFKDDKPSAASSPKPTAETAAAPQQSGGFFANLFKDPYAGMTSRQIWEEYNKSGNPGDFVRADRAMMAEREAAKKSEKDEGKAKGGAVAGKDAAIHKALEIIHHMLTRGH